MLSFTKLADRACEQNVSTLFRHATLQQQQQPRNSKDGILFLHLLIAVLDILP